MDHLSEGLVFGVRPHLQENHAPCVSADRQLVIFETAHILEDCWVKEELGLDPALVKTWRASLKIDIKRDNARDLVAPRHRPRINGSQWSASRRIPADLMALSCNGSGNECRMRSGPTEQGDCPCDAHEST